MIITSVYLTIPSSEINNLPLYTRSFILLPLPVFIGNTQYQMWGDGDVYLRACARYTESGRRESRGKSFVQKGFTPWEITAISFDTDQTVLKEVSKMNLSGKLAPCLTPAMLHGNFGRITVIMPLDQLYDLHAKVTKTQTAGDKKIVVPEKPDNS